MYFLLIIIEKSILTYNQFTKSNKQSSLSLLYKPSLPYSRNSCKAFLISKINKQNFRLYQDRNEKEADKRKRKRKKIKVKRKKRIKRRKKIRVKIKRRNKNQNIIILMIAKVEARAEAIQKINKEYRFKMVINL
jgi:hypothetical protein